MDWKTFTHTLKHPITIDGKTITVVTLREPDVNALEAIDDLGIKDGTRPKIGQVKAILVALGDQPAEVIGRLHRDDWTALNEAIAPLLLGEEAQAEALSLN